MKITVTQFLLPDGRQRQVEAEIPDELRPKYEAIRKNKLRLTAEILTTGVVSQCIEHEEGDFAIDICPNQLGMPEKHLSKLIEGFDEAAFHVWLKNMEADNAE